MAPMHTEAYTSCRPVALHCVAGSANGPTEWVEYTDDSSDAQYTHVTIWYTWTCQIPW